jgi:CheY-like chemotaxis protein
MALNFIMIDNNELNCFIIQKMLANTNASIPLNTFVHAQEGYEFIKNHSFQSDADKTILLLDIHMPLMDGFEFLNEFDQLPETTKKHYTIYILTSSTDRKDKQRSTLSGSVKKFLSKPLTFDILKNIIEESNNTAL